MPAEWTDAEFELLSAYIDGQLEESDRTALEARLGHDADLRQELAAMRQTVSLLRDLPTIRAPRAFTLTPEMVGQTAVPAAARAELRVLPPSGQARPARRTWWIPAASAAAVVLVAGVFVVMQQTSSGQPASVQQGVAVASTPTAILEGSLLNTVVQQSVTQAEPIGAADADQNTDTATGGQGNDRPEDDLSDEQDDGVAVGAIPNQEAARETTLVVSTSQAQPQFQAAATQGVMPAAPVAPPAEIQTGQGEPRFALTATDEMLDAMIAPLPTQMATASPDPNPYEPVGAGSVLPDTAGGAGNAAPGAVAGMDVLNLDPNAPGFSVATLSPIQGTFVAQYNAPEPQDAQPEPDTVEAETSSAAEVQESASDVKQKTDPIWIRWFNTLSEWVQRLMGQ